MGKTKTQFVGDTLEEKKPASAAKASARQGKPEKKDNRVRLAGQKGGERIKLVDAAPILVEETAVAKKAKKAKVRSRKYLEAKGKVDRNKLYSTKEAVELVKETSLSKFDGTITLHLVVKKEGLSTSLTLPHSTGKAKKIEVASEETIKKLEKGVVDFDVLLATADMMPKLVPFARILGPKGLMPNPKTGTLIKSAKDAERFNAAKLNIKTEKGAPVMHITVGKVSMKPAELAENIEAVLEAVSKKQIVKAYLAPTMGPSVKVAV